MLGAGYVGRALVEAVPGSVGTHRRGEPRFDLRDTATWGTLPPADDVCWTFPAEPADLCGLFFERALAGRRVVVLGSTGSCARVALPGRVTEETPLQPGGRVDGEEDLRRRGARVARLAGLWGPGRDPADWVRAGRVMDGRKHVNLCHVDDAVAAIRALFHAPPGTVVNVSDGEPRRWSAHVQAMVRDGRLPPGTTLPRDDDDGVRVSNDRVRALLPPGHVFRRLT